MFDKLYDENSVLKDPKDKNEMLKKSKDYVPEGEFEKQYQILINTKEFKGRPENVNEHTITDKILALNKLKTTFHDGFNP